MNFIRCNTCEKLQPVEITDTPQDIKCPECGEIILLKENHAFNTSVEQTHIPEYEKTLDFNKHGYIEEVEEVNIEDAPE